jgi:hypothetical protein
LQLESAKKSTEARRLPGLLIGAIKLTWQANRVGFIVAALLQVVGALVVSAFVLVGRSALNGLLTIGQGGGSPTALISVAVVLVVITARGRPRRRCSNSSNAWSLSAHRPAGEQRLSAQVARQRF